VYVVLRHRSRVVLLQHTTALPCGLVVGSDVGVHVATSIHDGCWIAISAIGLVHAEGGKGFRQL